MSRSITTKSITSLKTQQSREKLSPLSITTQDSLFLQKNQLYPVQAKPLEKNRDTKKNQGEIIKFPKKIK